MADATLLPCPFCGGDDIFMEPDEYGSGGQWVYPIHVGCSRCKVEIVCVNSDTKEDAIEAWNTRQPPSQVPAEDVGTDLLYLQACKAELDGPDWQPNRAVWADLCNTALSLTALQVTEGDKVREKYEELIYAVSIKHPQEDRHETALRYIRQAEQGNGGTGRSQSNKVSKP
jgi:Lar family restriction alleviation protein